MSTARIQPQSERHYAHLVEQTIEACRVAQGAAAVAAECVATGSSALLNTLREREKELDKLDMEIDAGVTQAITQVSEAEARELLACMKFMIGLERIGDLLLSFGSSAQAAGARVDSQDVRDLTQMATILEKMLGDVGDRTIVFGHSHQQFRRPGPHGTDLLNPGSVGMPLDGDKRRRRAACRHCPG